MKNSRFVHVIKKSDLAYIKAAAAVKFGSTRKRPKGRPKKRRPNKLKQDLKKLKIENW